MCVNLALNFHVSITSYVSALFHSRKVNERFNSTPKLSWQSLFILPNRSLFAYINVKTYGTHTTWLSCICVCSEMCFLLIAINLLDFLALSASLNSWLACSFVSHLHIHSDPQLFVYFWDSLIRGQMCRLSLAAAEVCRVEEWKDMNRGEVEGLLICSPLGCNHALGFIRWAEWEWGLCKASLELPVVCTNRPILEHSG